MVAGLREALKEMSVEADAANEFKDYIERKSVTWTPGRRELDCLFHMPKRLKIKDVKKKMGGFIYFHGGAGLAGSAEEDGAMCDRWAHECGVMVISVNYRLAPEHVCPAGPEDGYDVVKFFTKQRNANNFFREHF